jgi:hypothetical protein
MHMRVILDCKRNTAHPSSPNAFRPTIYFSPTQPLPHPHNNDKASPPSQSCSCSSASAAACPHPSQSFTPHPAPGCYALRKLAICSRLDFICCSARLLVMPHSATSVAQQHVAAIAQGGLTSVCQLHSRTHTLRTIIRFCPSSIAAVMLTSQLRRYIAAASPVTRRRSLASWPLAALSAELWFARLKARSP